MGKFFLHILTLMLLILSFVTVSAGAVEQQSDIRILVDVSGSMKQNDPGHLRRPAVRLLGGILPVGSRAGIWMFAEDPQKLVPVARVTAQWKSNLRQQANKIHDRGLFTNIGKALETAASDWQGSPGSQQRIMVLLTDGVVDISKNQQKNQVERLRIQTEVIPELRKLGARVYTIALSDDADKQLLAQIANATDAWFEAVKNAQELEKVFLKIFEQSVNVPEVPLTDNRFKIDRSIKEFTALIFKKNNDAIYLKSPSGKTIEAETQDVDITWFSDENFDLITLANPKSGQWKILGPVDPDNRVIVVSDLKLNVNNDELPTSLMAGDELILKASLQEKNKIIKKATFLSLVNFIGQISSSEIDQELNLQDGGEAGDEKKHDGIFSYRFKAPEIDEEVTFDLRVVSPTFERLYHRSVRVYSSWFGYQVKPAGSGNENHLISVIPEPTLIDSNSLKIMGVLKNPDGSEIDLEFSRQEDGHWLSSIVPDNIGGRYIVTLQIKAKTLSGKDVVVNDHQIIFETEKKPEIKINKKKKKKSTDPTAAESTLKTKTSKEKMTDDQQPQAQLKTPEIPKPNQEKSAEKIPVNQPSGLTTQWWIIIGAVFNVIFFGGGFFAWKRWKKKQSTEGEELAGALEDDSQPENTSATTDSKNKKGE